MKKKAVTCFLLAILMLLFFGSVYAQQTKIANQYVTVNYEPLTGRYAFVTIAGDPAIPSDDNRPMTGDLLGSYAIVKIDDQYFKFGDTVGKMVSKTIQADRSEHVWQIQGLEIRQELRISQSPYTMYPYNINIKYWVRNNDSKAHKVGIRILLDTFLGLDDAIPFFIPEMQPLDRELELNKAMVPDMVCAWDSVSSPATRLVLNLKGKEVCKPDYIMFGNRKKLSSVMWDVVPDAGKGFRNNPVDPCDTAVSMRWEPITFKAGYENGIAIDYGLGVASFNSRIPPLEVLFFAPQRVNENDEFWIMAEAYNDDNQRSVKNVKLKIELPDGLKLVKGAEENVIASSLDPLKGETFYWRVKAEKKGAYEYKLKGTGVYNSAPAISMTANKITVE